MTKAASRTSKFDQRIELSSVNARHNARQVKAAARYVGPTGLRYLSDASWGPGSSAIPWSALIRAVAVTASLPVVLSLIMARPHPRVLLGNAFCFVLATYLSTIVHEIGHALGARIVGMRVWRIVLGSGPTIAQGKVFDTELQVGVLPVGGLTFMQPESDVALRRRYAAAIAAGPATTAAILVAALSFREPIDFTQIVAPFQMLALANGVLLLAVLVPLRLSSGMGLQATDGWLLLNLPFLPKPQIAELRCARLAYEIITALERRNARRALELSEAALSQFPDSLALATCKASACLGVEDFSHARTLLSDLVTRPGLDRGVRLLLQNNLAWATLQLADDALLAEADALSETVVRQLRRTAWANGTRGAILVQRGRAAEGRRYLKVAFDHNTEQQARAHNAAWLAIADTKLGNSASAGEWLALAERLDPSSYSLARARAVLNDGPRTHRADS